jgi:Fe2+ transport system protein FeoA
MATNDITLASLKNGQSATIQSIDATDPQVQRLMVLGLAGSEPTG